jgi:hypothetical protein
MIRLYRMLALVFASTFALSLSAFAKEGLPTAEAGGTGGPKAWISACVSDSQMAMESGTKFCQCLWDKVGPENVPPLNMLKEMSPEVVDSCTTTGPKPWIKQCIADSKMAMESGTAYCQCIWDKVGPENVPPLSVLKEMDPDTLAACKK